MEINCKHHGQVEAFLERQNKDGKQIWRCPDCKREKRSRCIQKRKQTLADAFGGKCQGCGYDRCMSALQFHHVDPSNKEFEVGHMTVRYGIERLLNEAKKCVMVCANCHCEIHSGIRECPSLIY